MHSAASEDQRLLVESVRRFLQAGPDTVSRCDGVAVPADACLRWREAAAQGWFQVLVSEERGGLGLATLDAALMVEEMGRHLLSLPVSQAMSFAGLLATLEAPDEYVETLTRWLDGSRCYGVSVMDAGARGNWAEYVQVGTEVLVTGWNNGRLHVEIQSAVHPGHGLDPFIATALLPQAGEPNAGMAWALPCSGQAWRRFDGQRRVLRLAELIGVSSVALDKAVAHACEREQFGRPIGINQAVKHALANNWMALDNARLVLHEACALLDEGGAPDSATLSMLMAELLAQEASAATAQAIQTYGAMGIAWESGMHFYLRRARHSAAVLRSRHDADAILEHIWALSGT